MRARAPAAPRPRPRPAQPASCPVQRAHRPERPAVQRTYRPKGPGGLAGRLSAKQEPPGQADRGPGGPGRGGPGPTGRGWDHRRRSRRSWAIGRRPSRRRAAPSRCAGLAGMAFPGVLGSLGDGEVDAAHGAGMLGLRHSQDVADAGLLQHATQPPLLAVSRVRGHPGDGQRRGQARIRRRGSTRPNRWPIRTSSSSSSADPTSGCTASCTTSTTARRTRGHELQGPHGASADYTHKHALTSRNSELQLEYQCSGRRASCALLGAVRRCRKSGGLGAPSG